MILVNIPTCLAMYTKVKHQSKTKQKERRYIVSTLGTGFHMLNVDKYNNLQSTEL